MIFPNHTQEERDRRIQVMWGIHAGFVVLPRFTMHCPQCRSTEIQLSSITYDRFPKYYGEAYRANVQVKCTMCSHFDVYGVPISGEVFSKAVDYLNGGNNLQWREAYSLYVSDPVSGTGEAVYSLANTTADE